MEENTGKKHEGSVTLKTIADELGISVTAVSQALRGASNISEDTKKKVRETAKAFNYLPNSVARSLRTKSTKTLGLIVSDSSFSFFAPLIEGAEKTAAENGYNIILCNAYSNAEKEREAVRVLANKRVDGIILAATMLGSAEDRDFLDSVGVPYVFAVRESECSGCEYVINDNNYGSYQMVSYLIRTGSKRVFFINIHSRIMSYSARLAGYKSALAENGIEYNSSYVYNAKPSVEDGYRAMSQILSRYACDEIDAVFCGCDVIAIGALEAAIERGISVPGDIRVAGYDDIEYAAYLRVPLTTVRQPKYRMGKLSVEILVDRISGKNDMSSSVVLRPDLVLRSST